LDELSQAAQKKGVILAGLSKTSAFGSSSSLLLWRAA